jgi:hypothetical protein
MYISDWEIHTNGIRNIIQQAVENSKIVASDTVWHGPSGDAVIAATAADIEEEYGDYIDSGQVEEYLD